MYRGDEHAAPPPNRWPNDDYSKNALFIAQTILESLGERNFEGFRAPALDNLERLRELSRSAQANIRSAKQLTNFDPMLEELRNTLPGSVLAQVSPSETDVFLESIGKNGLSGKSELKRCRLQTQILINILENSYRTHIRAQLKECFKNHKSKLRTHGIVKEFVSHLINSGYSKDFIRLHCKICFFSKDINSRKSKCYRY